MKIKIAVLCLLACFASMADPTTNAPSVMLAWDSVTDPAVNGYRLYWGVQSRSYTNWIAVNGALTSVATVSNLTRRVTYYFAATSTDTNGMESEYSNEVSYRTLGLPAPPTGLTVTILQP